MRFIKDTLSFIFQVLLIIFVNLFFADFIVLFIILALCMYANEDSNICQYLDLVYPILKFPSLPILYNILYKISKNKIILGFIHLLKTNILFKIFILFLTLIPEYLFFISNSKSTSIFAYVYIFIYFGLFGSYLFLFFWWEIEKWWKSDCDKWYSSKRIKNTQLYLKISKIFNKIQDFNYQNFKKCQKIVFVIVTLIFKWSGKVGLKINKVLKTKII